MKRCAFLTAALLLSTALALAGTTDPFLWLEQRHGARALAWVKQQDARTLAILESDPHYAKFYADAFAIASSKDRIPMPELQAGRVYNFWQDTAHERGVWRSTTIRSYETATPRWAPVLDIDALDKTEHADWAWKGANCEEPSEQRCMVALSHGGEDAITLREFDLRTRAFVPNGFTLSYGKQSLVWLDRNTLLAARAWKPDEVTTSGYPYVVKRWRRGEPLSRAVEIFRGARTDVSVDPLRLVDGAGHSVTMIVRAPSFFETDYLLLTPRGLRRVAVPLKSSFTGMVDGWLLLQLNEDWNAGGKRFAQGSLVSVNLGDLRANPANLHPRLVYAPGPRETLDTVAVTKTAALLVIYANVRARAFLYTPVANGWRRRRLALPDNSSIDVAATNPHTDAYFVDSRGFLIRTSLYAGNAASSRVVEIKRLPPQFDATRDVVDQHEATSRDGTRIPYFVVHSKKMVADGSNPTVLYGYGGFAISMTPFYSGVIGRLWLSRGGVFVLANIRGGGEFGPAWHDAGLKTHRQRIYDDFYAVGRDLVARKITSPRHLGIMGGSNGGLLVGVEMVQHPEMWHAVDIQVPLLDMLRYEKIEAGASWVGEYGSVSVPAERAFLAKTSPYNNLEPNVAYPEPFIWTTTKDDRVGPQHARKFAAKMASMHLPYLFYEVVEGGHAAGVTIREGAKTRALEWTYFTMKLMGGGGSK